ncbi:MAG: glycoside hydrolase family 73 protein [Firmicutes bacterium]|nr:glycoside hydrolase family 73 protein [Bacillota bacterium]
MDDYIEPRNIVAIGHITNEAWKAAQDGSGTLPSLTIAQAILESGWGKSELAQKANALFGVKAGANWKGPRMDKKTSEHIGGKKVEITAAFRAYGSWEESIADHGALLRGARYKAVAGERDYKKACRAVHAAGYATAPDYADSLIKLIEQYGLTAWDEPAAAPALKTGDRVQIVAYGIPYFPGGKDIPDAPWMKGKVMTVNGLGKQGNPPVPCARLAEISSWCAVENLQKVEG